MERRAGAQIDVWVVEPDVVLADRERELDDVERRRARTLPPAQAARFVLARVLLRRAVAAVADTHPWDVTLAATCPTCGGDHGPVVVLVPDGWWASVTRSGPLVAVAVSDHPVGVDIEDMDAVTAAPLADVALSSDERARHDRLPPGARDEDLARTWVRKEAVLKALGTGLVTDPRTVELDGPGMLGVRGSGMVGPDGPGALGPDEGVGQLGVMRSGSFGVIGREDLTVADLTIPGDREGQGVVGAVASVAAPGRRRQQGLRGRVRRRSGSHEAHLVVRIHDGAALLADEPA